MQVHSSTAGADVRAADQLFPVTFDGDSLVLASHEGEPYVVMKPAVSALGLDWKSQHAKLTEKFSATMGIITTVAEDGKLREMLSLPLRKFPGWLYTINPSKVAPELRDKILRYQNECDEVLWAYWTSGVAVRPGYKPPSLSQQISLSNQVCKLMNLLEGETHPEKRRVLHGLLERATRLLGIEPPTLARIGKADPQMELEGV